MKSAERWSIKEPIPEIYAAWSDLNKAVDAHLAGDRDHARELFARHRGLLPTDNRVLWHWLNPTWGPSPAELRKHVCNPYPVGDTKKVPEALRDRKAPTTKTMSALLARDGYRCRYCGIPVVSAAVRKRIHAAYPEEVPWVDNHAELEHAALQVFWLQYYHVVPWSHGGRSDFENVVVCCALCQYGKADSTLAMLDISDPRLRPPVPCDWDGLERFR